MKSTATRPQPSDAGVLRTDARRTWWIVLGLSLGPAVTNGFARFAYGLILPDMRADLGWTFTEAGWINTANAIGYLVGALLALGLIGRLGPRRLFTWGMALTALALAFSATTRDLATLSVWRILAGIGGAPVFIAGGAMASALFRGDPARNALAIAVYFGGGGLGMLLTGISLPLFMEWFGAPGWPLAWLALGIAAFLGHAASFAAAEAVDDPPPTPGGARRPAMPVLALMPALLAYFMFGVGYIIYVTFLIAWMEARGAPATLVALTWALLSVAVMASPFLWRAALARARAGGAIALTMLVTGLGMILPLLVVGQYAVLVSALLFGAAFFMVPTAVTALCRHNLPEPMWGGAIALFTVVFALGQIVGPVGAGLIADETGTPALSLLAGGMVLIFGALLSVAQRKLMLRNRA